jgi:hypothetical protein
MLGREKPENLVGELLKPFVSFFGGHIKSVENRWKKKSQRGAAIET